MGPSLRALCPDALPRRERRPGGRPGARWSRQLRAAPLRGLVYGMRGRGGRRTLTPVALADLLFDADYNPALRAGVPAAVRAALDGDDPAPLLRLLAGAASCPRSRAARVLRRPLRDGVRGDAAAVAARDAARRTERAAAREADRLGRRAFSPFDAEARADEIDLCLRWPEASPAPAAGGAYPAVPTLILQGGEDLRTPPRGLGARGRRDPGRGA